MAPLSGRGVISDITEQVQAEQKPRDQEQELRRMLSVLPIPVGSNRLAGDQEIVFLNQRFLDTFGYAAEELPTLEAWAERAYPDPAYRQQVMQVWQHEVERCLAGGGDVGSMELQVACKDGSFRDVILTATLRDDRMVGAFIDVAERKRAEAALEQAYRREAELTERQRLELEAKLRTSLTAAAVAHEINQPLSSILINAQLLQAQLRGLPEGDGRNLLRPLLEQQVEESERIVTTIEKMRMLLRNVQTERQHQARGLWRGSVCRQHRCPDSRRQPSAGSQRRAGWGRSAVEPAGPGLSLAGLSGAAPAGVCRRAPAPARACPAPAPGRPPGWWRPSSAPATARGLRCCR